MFKKISYFLIAAAALSFAACSDQNEVVDDLYKEIENTPIAKEFPYTLTSNDYAAISRAAVTAAGEDTANAALARAVASTNSLNSFADAGTFVPAVLKANNPGLHTGSAIQVTYNYSEVLPAYPADLAAAEAYPLTAADYTSVWKTEEVGYLTPTNAPSSKLPAILKAALPDAEEGDIVIASYKYSDQEPDLTPSEIMGEVTENFEGYAANDEINQNGWSQYLENGTKKWVAKSYSGNIFAEMTSYGGTAEKNDAYLISPEIDLAKNQNPVFMFDAELRFPVDGQDFLRVLISTDYTTSSPASATWDDVTDGFIFPTRATNSMDPVGSMSLLAYAGETIRIAFKYQGDGTASPAMTTTLRIDNVQVVDASGVTEFYGETLEDKGYANYDKWEDADWTQVITQGTKNWQVRFYNDNLYGQMSANGGADEISEAYMISPEIDLSATTNNFFSFNVCAGYWNYNSLSVLITEDAAALTTPADVAWDDVSACFLIPQEPASGYGTLSPAGTISLRKYDGKKIYIAFKYYGEKGTGNTWTSTYQVDNISVGSLPAAAASNAVAAQAVISTPVEQKAIYTYNGTAWVPYPGAIILNPADYVAMGSNYGNLEPAQATAKLPQFLDRNVDYKTEGDIMAVVYVRYEGSAKTVADEYVYSGGAWTPTNVPVVRTEQFIYAEDSWLFDPTVNYTLTHDDYAIMCNYAKNTPILQDCIYNHSSGNISEYYYGFSENYNNVSFRLSYYIYPADTELTALPDDASKAKLLWKRLVEEGMPIFAALRWPDAVDNVQGVQVYYNITVPVYFPDGVTNTTTNYTLRYKVTKGGPNPTFEYETGAPEDLYTPSAE